MKNVNIIIDGVKISTSSNKTILEAALENGIYIPNLCHHEDLVPSGNCRMCLVEVEGMRGQTIACKTPITEGMTIKTESEDIKLTRQTSLELIHANHTQDCTTCSKNNQCELQKVTAFVGINQEGFNNLRRTKPYIEPDKSNPFFILDHNKCIMCGICVRTCDEVQGVNALNYGNRGFETVISTFMNKPIIESVCESCGECVVRCPVGALQPIKTQIPTREVKTVCSYCGVGCNIILGVRDNKIVSSRGDRTSIVNKGRLCVKGRFGYEFVNNHERLTTPLIKKDGKFVTASWDEAFDLIAEKFAKSKKDKFAALASAKITNEENYVIQKFTRAVMGTNNIDHCARLCHAPTVSGLVQSFGSGAMTNSIDEFINAKTIFSIGSNTTAAHPIIGLHIKQAKRNGAKIIVANPKEIDLVRFADIHIRQKPGSDVALVMGMARVIIEEGLVDRKFIEERTEDYDKLVESLAEFSLKQVEKLTGVPQKQIIEAARLYATNTPSSIVYAMGITQHTHGTDNVLAISNLALLTGNIGKESSGVNPLRGQNNVQGACDMGGLPDVYTGYQNVTNPAAQQKFEKAWGVSLSNKVGITHTEIFDQIEEGKITALYQVGENPVLSEANANHVKKALDKLDFFVVQDIFFTESAKYADVVLPAATFAEKNGTFTNTERRVQRVRKAINPIGDSKEDWKITCGIAKRMGEKGFDFESEEEIFEEIRQLTPSYAGITYERIEKVGLQWPCPTTEHMGTKILHTERFAVASGKAKFIPLTYRLSDELPDKDYPLLLTTDRSLFHYHTSTMTRRVEGLRILDSEELLRIHPEDAKKYGIKHGDMVKAKSRRGEVTVKVDVNEICPQGVVSMTFHFFETPTNELTICSIDPVAKIPETKVCSIKIEKINME
ncbi:MAG TPA: formate dehydrogenase subunit alpha [Bacteroidales bacterium]|nr:MAG: formate dehydrogenase subunit alpha [Bacteroidetes bacterium GWF2_33_38]OFY89686.1 MAG: formate dehydrogenase subunit alpha [Bacteroidetes bacterium RIFOXYA2_FULL_33_7]HBF87057.1 formate dehydrogenase subunit alpha [Bacteroidales bacterium]